MLADALNVVKQVWTGELRREEKCDVLRAIGPNPG